MLVLVNTKLYLLLGYYDEINIILCDETLCFGVTLLIQMWVDDPYYYKPDLQ